MNIWQRIEQIEKVLEISVPGAEDARNSVLSGTIIARQGQVFLMGFDPIQTVGDLAGCQNARHAKEAVMAWSEDQIIFSRYELAQNP